MLSGPQPFFKAPTMIPLKSLRTAALSIAMVVFATLAQAELPPRVARLGDLAGEVSLLEAGNADWVQAPLNQPLASGDNLWTDQNARAELQVEGAAFRLGELSNLSILNLDEGLTRLQLMQGALRLRVRTLGPEQSIEVNTPNLTLVLRRAGDYRVEVGTQDGATQVLVHSGMAEIFGENATYRVSDRQAYRFYGTGLSEFAKVSDYGLDELDRWAMARERRLDDSVSARYVPAGVVGYEDLDAYGRWVFDGNYGNVWLPSRVNADWTPYRDGRWTWVDPWGWTWIDNAPWGYAVTHYGRWANLGNVWAWVPGATHERVVYAPALVVFVAGEQGHFPRHRHLGMGNTAWFPLGPREIYRQHQTPTRDDYVNQHVRGAVVVANQLPVPRVRSTELRSRPSRENHPVEVRDIPRAPVAPAFVAPEKSRRPAETPPGMRIFTPGAAEVRAPMPVPINAPMPFGRNGTSRGEQPIAEVPKHDAQRGDLIRNEAARVERPRHDAVRSDTTNVPAARPDAGSASARWESAAKVEAANAARNAQGVQSGRDGETQRGNAQRPDKQSPSEEDLLPRGKRR